MNFTKLQAAGNDFVLIDARDMDGIDWPSLARQMCDRHFGIGADGIILVLDSQTADLKMRIFNADGSEAETCGNGLRCFAKFTFDNQLVASPRLTVESLAGIKSIDIFASKGKVNRAKVNMGTPLFKANQIPLKIDREEGDVELVDIMYHISVVLKTDDGRLDVYAVSMGNPHAVHFIHDPVGEYALDVIGPQVEHYHAFPERTNYEIARIIDRHKIEARVWERGVGETLACGSGACAIAVASRLCGYTDGDVDILLPGGTLTIGWDGEGDVLLTGPVEQSFTGDW